MAISKTEQKALNAEVNSLSSLNHPNIIKIFEVSVDGNYKKRDGSESKCKFIALELAKGG